MLFKLFFLSLLPILVLYAEPSMAEVKQAVMQNPALLNTPQAQAAMQEKGVTLDEVKQKLDVKATETSKTADVVTTDVKNDIEVDKVDTDKSTTETTDTETDKAIQDAHATDSGMNPFAYQTSENIKKKLLKKQLFFSENKLARYSNRFFANKNQIDIASLPTPSNYIISTGDVFNINIYGDREKEFSLDVQNDGTLQIPFLGPIKVGGMSFADAKTYLTSKLSQHYKTSNFNINISKYSSIQVTLVGEVKAPGLYNIASYSTVKDLLNNANGIQKNGSLRDIIIKRDSQIIAHIDFYDLLFKGEDFGSILLKHGDIVMIKQAKILVSIDGLVNNAAIFELKENEKLNTLIKFAGGMTPDASKINIKIKRFKDNSTSETFEIAYSQAKNFKMQNGDKIYIYPLDFSAQSSVNIYGNIIRPGNYNLGTSKTLNELLKKNIEFGAKKFFLPQTYFEYAVLKRYNEKLTYTVESFDLEKVLNNTQTVLLKSQDEIFIFNQNDITSSAYVTTVGTTLMKAGKLQYYNGMSVKDAIHASGVNGVIDDKIRLTTFNTKDFMPITKFISQEKDGNTTLSPYDEIEVYDYYNSHILEPITIQGEVVKPMSTFYEKGMNVAKLLKFAGGFTKRAYTNNIEIIRYYVDEKLVRQRNIIKIDIKDKSLSEIELQPYDEVTIFKIPQWGEKQSVELSGQVNFPGTYTIEEGEQLATLLKRAGGFTNKAFVDGAVFTRESIKQNQIEQYNSSLSQIKRQLAIYNAMPANSKQSASMGQAVNALSEVMVEAQKYQPIGRINIMIDNNLSKIEESAYNIVLKNKDTITIPSSIDTVTVFGEVYNPSSFVYDGEKGFAEYIKLASGYSKAADKESVYVIHANGISEPVNTSWFYANSNLRKGDTIVVPIYIQEFSNLEIWDSASKILSNFAITAAAFNTLGITK